MSQLRMVFNAEKESLPEFTLPAGFRLRTVKKEELTAYSALRLSAGFDEWQENTYHDYVARILQNGLLVIEDTASGRLAASAGAEPAGREELKQFGVLGWVMSHPDYRGKRLGYMVCAAVMHTLYQNGYRMYYLLTDDQRIPAIKTYLNLGWKPWLYEPDMEERWQKIAGELGRSFESLEALPEQIAVPPKL